MTNVNEIRKELGNPFLVRYIGTPHINTPQAINEAQVLAHDRAAIITGPLGGIQTAIQEVANPVVHIEWGQVGRPSWQGNTLHVPVATEHEAQALANQLADRVVVLEGALHTAAEAIEAIESGHRIHLKLPTQDNLRWLLGEMSQSGMLPDDHSKYFLGFDSPEGLHYNLQDEEPRNQPSMVTPQLQRFYKTAAGELEKLFGVGQREVRLLGKTGSESKHYPGPDSTSAQEFAQAYILGTGAMNLTGIRRFLQEVRMVATGQSDRKLYATQSRFWDEILNPFIQRLDGRAYPAMNQAQGIAGFYELIPEGQYQRIHDQLHGRRYQAEALVAEANRAVVTGKDLPYLQYTTNATKQAEARKVADALGVEDLFTMAYLYEEPRRDTFKTLFTDRGKIRYDSPELEGTTVGIAEGKLELALEKLLTKQKGLKETFPNGVILFVVDIAFQVGFLSPGDGRPNGWDLLQGMGIKLQKSNEEANGEAGHGAVRVGRGFNTTKEPFPGIYVGRVLDALVEHYHLTDMTAAEKFANAWYAFLNEPHVQAAMRQAQERGDLRQEHFTARQYGGLSSAYIGPDGAVTHGNTLTKGVTHEHHYVPQEYLQQGKISIPYDDLHATAVFLYGADGISHAQRLLDRSEQSITEEMTGAFFDQWDDFVPTVGGQPMLREAAAGEGLRRVTTVAD